MLVCESQVEEAKINGSTGSPRRRFSVVTCQPFHLHWFNLFYLTLSLTAYFVPLLLTACVPEKTDNRGRLQRKNGGSELFGSGRQGLCRDLASCSFAAQPNPTPQFAKVNVYNKVKYTNSNILWFFLEHHHENNFLLFNFYSLWNESIFYPQLGIVIK